MRILSLFDGMACGMLAMSELKLKFGIQIDKMRKGSLALGVGFSHYFGGETYLYINLIKWSISIGMLNKGES